MRFILFCLLTLLFVFARGQESDTVWINKGWGASYEKKVNETTNYYTKKTVSTFGHYGSMGYGGGRVKGLAGVSLVASYSLAYKSHLITLTYNVVSHNVNSSSHEPYYFTQYNGLLFGEALRYKHLMFSLSAGVAYSAVNYQYQYIYPIGGHNYFVQNGISFPIELKALLLARNGVGIGLYVSENIITTPKYSPFSFGGYYVFGHWNNRKKKTAKNNPN